MATVNDVRPHFLGPCRSRTMPPWLPSPGRWQKPPRGCSGPFEACRA